MSEPDFPDILQHFELSGHFDSAAVYGSGHINDTWLVRFAHSDRLEFSGSYKQARRHRFCIKASKNANI